MTRSAVTPVWVVHAQLEVPGHPALGGEAMAVASASCQVLVKRTSTHPGSAI